MSNGEKQTGISDGAYNPTSLVFRAAEGGTPHAKYTQYAGQERETTSSPTSSGRCSRMPGALSRPGPGPTIGRFSTLDSGA